MVRRRREELPADTSNKTKDTGRKHKHSAQLGREQEFQTMHESGEMHTDKRIKKRQLQFNTTVKSGFSRKSRCPRILSFYDQPTNTHPVNFFF